MVIIPLGQILLNMSGILSVLNWGIGNSEGDAGFEERLGRGKGFTRNEPIGHGAIQL